MSAPLNMGGGVPIYALSGAPHPDTPQVPAGMAARTEADTARNTPCGPAPPASPSRRRFRFRLSAAANTNSFQFAL